MDPPDPPPIRKPLRKNRIRKRKAFKHVKKHVNKPKPEAVPDELQTTDSSDVSSDVYENSLDVEYGFDQPATRSTPAAPSPSLGDHDYVVSSPECRASSSMSRPDSSLSRPSSSFSHVSNISGSVSVSMSDVSFSACEDVSQSDSSSTHLFCPISPAPRSSCHEVPDMELVNEVPSSDEPGVSELLIRARNQLLLMLPSNCVPIVDQDSLHARQSKAVQRQVTVSLSGDIKIEVHGEDFPENKVLSGVSAQKLLKQETSGQVVDRIVKVVSNLRLFEVCAGMNRKEYKEAWAETSQGTIEGDTFKECRYTETFRSKKCTVCNECTKLIPAFKRRLTTRLLEEPLKHTNHRFMSSKQKDVVLAKKQRVIKTKNQTITRLEAKINEMIEKEGVTVEKSLSDAFREILLGADLNPKQIVFLEQQIKFIECKKKTSMRWHPTLIRLALSLYLKAPGAYKDLQESGFIALPSARTLFDYSHVTKIEPGVNSHVLDILVKQVKDIESVRSQPQYHVLMGDEIHISKNLVLLKSTGEIIGFRDLDALDQELASLELHLSDPEKQLEPDLASKVMAFMVKGVSSNVKHVVASYPVCSPSPRQLYIWTWDVIGALERSGLKVIAYTCDGAPTNRSFIQLHKPVTKTASGVVFDTVNKYAPERVLNAFFNSRKETKNKKKSPRRLRKNGELIVWDTIIRLYMSKKDKTLRKSFKLNAQNVFPDSYSRMKVKIAAAVLSNTVALDILSQGWPSTSETVEFIQREKNWFDLLNGAFSTQGIRTNNRRLDAYTIKDVEDYDNNVEEDFQKYLDDWKAEVESRKDTSLMSDLGVQPLAGDDSFHALNDSQTEGDQEEDASSRNLLPHQTLRGIEMSWKSFIGATTFLLRNGVTFINARILCQDPLEQNFGRQRMAGGGSNNPNFHQYLHKQRGFSTIGALCAANKMGNTEVVKEDDESVCSSEPLPKRKPTGTSKC
ncbi:Transposable element P transposase [Frankliniella fusca]|uniref:Transposable element P transposase n=1 Tax=Frankliniella fusca TaxID=407009 RepID=A0AAE1LFE6_9NEOP|nr:Transposable element P transposase [Frankliniella fusca]